jgi:cytochrome c2
VHGVGRNRLPDSDMAFHVDKADERRDIIAYLKDLSGK